MSVADADSVDDGVYRTTFDPSTTPACVAVVEAIETALGAAASDSVLADSIDPDSLQQLYRDDSPDSWMLTFEHDGFEITLWGCGRIHIETTASMLSTDVDHGPAGEPARPAGAPTPPSGPSL